MNQRSIKMIVGLTLAPSVAAGCDIPSTRTGEWAGTAYDSAGITVVANPATGLWTEATAWTLEEDLRIGVVDGDRMREFGRIAGLAVDKAGQIYVLDGMAGEVRVFDARGEFINAFGRHGSGPGELSSPSAVLIGPGDTILVSDVRNARVQRFLVDGSVAGQFPIRMTGGIPVAWRARDGLLLEEYRQYPSAANAGNPHNLVLLRGGDGEVVDTLLEMESGGALAFRNGMAQMIVFAPEPMWALLEDGRLVTGRHSAYRIEIRDPNGQLERVVTKPFERLPLNDADRRALRAKISAQYGRTPMSADADHFISTMDFASHFPVFARLFGGPHGTLWVQKALQTSSFHSGDLAPADFTFRALGAQEYDIFDSLGRYLGTITPPWAFTPLITQGDYVYGVQADDVGVQHVARLRVVR